MRRNKFNLSYTQLMSCNMGFLMPCGLTEVLPGDTVQQASSILLRCSPLLAPVMHPIDVRIHHWFVPHRLVWEEWEDFITGGKDGMDDSVLPTRTFIPPAGGLSDYFGIPPGVSTTASVLPHRGYYLIWNEFYRDQDLQAELVFPTTGGPDVTAYAIQNVQWEKDYFTTARPWEQKGPSVSIPSPVSGLYASGTAQNPLGGSYWDTTGANAGSTPGAPAGEAIPSANMGIRTVTAGAVNATNKPEVYALTSIQSLREALAIQRFEEARARYGSRYTEYLRYLGVRSSDARLQRPEYLGGGKQTIQFSEVLQTAEGETSPVGEMRGHGITGMRTNRYRRFFEEHGYIQSLISIRPRTMYMQGLERTWNRRTKEDFWTKELETIGQQEVLNKEIFSAHSNPNGVFGYQDRYDEYRRHTSVVAGEFRSTLLNYWHLARDFGGVAPALNADFVDCSPSERIFAIPSQDTMYVMCRHSIQARRMLSKVARSLTF